MRRQALRSLATGRLGPSGRQRGAQLGPSFSRNGLFGRGRRFRRPDGRLTKPFNHKGFRGARVSEPYPFEIRALTPQFEPRQPVGVGDLDAVRQVRPPRPAALDDAPEALAHQAHSVLRKRAADAGEARDLADGQLAAVALRLNVRLRPLAKIAAVEDEILVA